MTEKVLITMKGLQFGDSSEDMVEVINIGQYSEVNGNIYIKYDEMLDEGNVLTSNLIKIVDDSVEIVKKGPITANMKFIVNEKTLTYYNTPFGSLYLGIFAREVDIDKQEDVINILIDYSLEINYEQISECKVEICIRPQERAVKLI